MAAAAVVRETLRAKTLPVDLGLECDDVMGHSSMHQDHQHQFVPERVGAAALESCKSLDELADSLQSVPRGVSESQVT
jgi:hypothetical protein